LLVPLAVGPVAAIAATQPWNWGGTGPYYGRPYVGSGALAANDCYGGPIELLPTIYPGPATGVALGMADGPTTKRTILPAKMT
jgi:hypothetical protein